MYAIFGDVGWRGRLSIPVGLRNGHNSLKINIIDTYLGLVRVSPNQELAFLELACRWAPGLEQLLISWVLVTGQIKCLCVVG